MTTLSRRQFGALASAAPLVAASTAFSVRPVAAANHETRKITRSTQISIAKPAGTTHSFVTDEAGVVTIHVIEGPSGLIIVDSSSGLEWSGEVRALVDALEKPVDAVFLSHDHPDHISGLPAFDGLPMFTTQGVKDNAVAAPWEVPDNWDTVEAIEAGERQLAGLSVNISVYTGAEALEQIVIEIPELDTAVVQDLVYNNALIFPGIDRPGWIRTLEELKGSLQSKTLLVGHGYPSSRGELGEQLDFLNEYDALVA
ncbi:MAG: MBL fold metallo-hydrolase, partial [Pseudomonadota bacterium]